MGQFDELQSGLAQLAEGGTHGTAAIVERVLQAGVSAGASDIHVEPTSSHLDIRFRIDGVLVPAARLHVEAAPSAVARLKVLAELLTYRTDVPQEGRLRTEQLGFDAGPAGELDLRVATFPTVHGEKAVVRIFDPQRRVYDLAELGLPKSVGERLTTALGETAGAVLLSGPSGSGKTTTLYACLRHIVRTTGGTRHLVTLEDPVEAILEGVTQTEINPAAGLDFARGLRSIVRQDPEVILVGEIRDRPTVLAAMEAALTGHLVFSTVHAGSACGVLARLSEMNVEPHVLTSAVRLVIHQRLVRQLCEACRTQLPEGAWGATGCEACRGIGYRGRVLLAEAVGVDGPLREAVLARSDVGALEAAVGGGERLIDSARRRLAEGLVDELELTRVLGSLWTVPGDDERTT